MTGDPKKELEEATEAVENLIEENKLPFARWLIKLLVEKVAVPVLVPALTAAGTAATGWYMIGQYQVKDEVKQEVRTHEDVRELIREAMDAHDEPTSDAAEPPLPDLEELRRLWEEEYAQPANLQIKGEMGGDGDTPQQFPIELVQEELERVGKKR